MESNIKKSIVIFVVIAALCGWLGVLLDKILIKQPNGYSLGMLIWIASPLISAILLVVTKKDGWKSFGIKPRFKGNIKWYIFAFIFFLLITFILVIIGTTLKWITLLKFNFLNFSGAFLISFIVYFLKNIFEEFSWRGYLTERLIVLKLSDAKIYAITTIVWFLWHIPYYLVLLPVEHVDGSRWALLLSAFITLACWSMLYTELYRITRSSWACGILHAVSNAMVIIYNYVSIQNGKAIFLNYDSGVISLIACIGIGVLLRRYRIKKVNMIENLS